MKGISALAFPGAFLLTLHGSLPFYTVILDFFKKGFFGNQVAHLL